MRIDPDKILEAMALAMKATGPRKTAATRAAALHVSLIQQGFAKSGVNPITAAPGAWPPLKSGRPSRLQKTGRLIGSINFRAEPGAYEAGPEPLPYAPWHQFGTDKIPARPYIVYPAPWAKMIADTYAEELVRESVRMIGRALDTPG
jgi:phage gpG-like protein